MTPTELRRDLYRLLDQVLDSGEPLEVQRGGRRLRVSVAPARTSKLDRLVHRPEIFVGDPEDLVHLSGAEGWEPGDPWSDEPS